MDIVETLNRYALCHQSGDITVRVWDMDPMSMSYQTIIPIPHVPTTDCGHQMTVRTPKACFYF